MSESQDRTCPLCGSKHTIYCSPISQDTVTMSFRDQSCASDSCGIPCRVWDQVEQLQAANAQLTKMLELHLDRTIDCFRHFGTEVGEDTFTPILRGSRGPMNNREHFPTQIEALEAAYRKWKKGEGDG